MLRNILILFALLLPVQCFAEDVTAEVTKAPEAPQAAPAETPKAEPAKADAVKAEPAASVDDKAAKDAKAEAPKPAPTWHHPPVPAAKDGMTNIVVIPIHEEIGKTNKFILRRGIKAAISKNAEVVVLEMDTPGGRADIMLEMMEMIDNYDGRTIAFVKKEAMSAGALISASAQEIYFAPKSVLGAAAVIQSTGEDIPETLKTKIDSYMDAKIRALTKQHPRRADVIRAMMQKDYVLTIDGKTIKDKGSLLSFTDDEALALYGDPPTPILSSGTYASIDDLARAEYGEGHYEIKRYELTWSEEAAMYMEKISPVLIGLGILCLIVEFYTPGFGLPGISGITILSIVFISNFIAGLAGYEPVIIFAIGFLLLMLELILFPGILVMAITGGLMMVGSLIWSLADIWPRTGGGFDFDYSKIISATYQVIAGIAIAIAAFAILYRFLPKRIFLSRMILEGASGNAPAAMPVTEHIEGSSSMPQPGSEGVAVSNLRPSGTVEINGVQYEASLTVGAAERGQRVQVVGRKDFQLLVKIAS
jgi:membrane-bound serine protease (ClpP class)